MDIFMKMLERAHQLKVQDGEVLLLGKNTAMVSLDVLVSLYDKLYEKGENGLLYNIAKDVVSEWAKSLLKKMPIPKEKALELSVRVLEMEGFGHGDIIRQDDKISFVYTKSTLAKVYLEKFGNSTAPVCNMLAGYLAGLLEATTGEPCDVKEVACKAKGDDICKFVVEGK